MKIHAQAETKSGSLQLRKLHADGFILIVAMLPF